jgi:hypothetical protein
MVDWVRRALTRKIMRRTIKGTQTFQVTPRDELVYGVKFAICMTICLTGMEIANMAFLHTWNSEVFSAITGLIGLVTGIFIGHRV